MRNRYKYQRIINETMNKDFIMKSEYIKENQCIDCKNKHCRLEIKDNICTNYKSG